MTQTDNPELDDLFERYKAAPKSHVFAPLADACRKAGMLDEALEICARGVGEHPRYASGYVVQGKCLYDAGRPADAQAAFDRVLLFDPKNLVALKYLGILHAERGDNAGAREYFEHILALDPDNRDIRSRIEDVELDAAHSPQASVRADDTMKIDAAAVHEMLAAGEHDQGEVIAELPHVEDEGFQGEAITLRDESVTSDEIATMTLADIYAAQGYTSRALKIYREVQKRQPDNRTLAMKIDALEKEVKASIEAARSVSAEGPIATTAPATSAPSEEKPVARRYEPAPPSRPTPAPAQGSPINQTQSYEQFKRWLKATR
jgi:tetratricopeptide (TPR) repeat protein